MYTVLNTSEPFNAGRRRVGSKERNDASKEKTRKRRRRRTPVILNLNQPP